jgi:hypothetical protein
MVGPPACWLGGRLTTLRVKNNFVTTCHRGPRNLTDFWVNDLC